MKMCFMAYNTVQCIKVVQYKMNDFLDDGKPKPTDKVICERLNQNLLER